jgi:NAD+ synthase
MTERDVVQSKAPWHGELRIAGLPQLNPTRSAMSDAGNLAKAREARCRRCAPAQGADLLLLTELFISGYPPEDLVLKPAFLRACLKAVEALAADTADGGPGVIVGFPRQGETGRIIPSPFSTAARSWRPRQGRPAELRRVRREARLHEGAMPGPVNFRGVRLGIPICEDIWNDKGVCETLAESGAEILLVPNGSPYYRGKIDVRHQVVLRQVTRPACR